MSEHVFCASSAAALFLRSDEGTHMLFMWAWELGRILWVTFLVRARKVTRLWVREPTLLTLNIIFIEYLFKRHRPLKSVQMFFSQWPQIYFL